MNDTQRRKYFQRLKNMTSESFWKAMAVLHTRAYAKAQEHYSQAMDCVLTLKQKAAVEAKAAEIRELWDGMQTITIDETEHAELSLGGGGQSVDASQKPEVG